MRNRHHVSFSIFWLSCCVPHFALPSSSEDGTIRMWYFDGALAPRADDEDQGNVPDSLAEAFADMKVTKEEGKEEL